MNNILIILGSYFPKPSPNGICVRQVAKELKNRGAKITIIANQSIGLTEYEDIDGIDIYRVKERWFRRAMDLSDLKIGWLSKLTKKILQFINKIQITLFLPLWPLVSPFYSLRIYKKAKHLHKTKRFDKIIAVYNPIDALIAGYFLKKKYKGINFTLYFLDTLSGGIAPKHFTRSWVKRRGWFWEKKFFEVADDIFIMESHKNHYFGQTYKKYNSKMNVVGIPLLSKIKKSESKYEFNFDSNRINLTYAGMLLKSLKNPEYMLCLFNRLSKQIDCTFHIFGGGDCSSIIDKYKQNTAENALVTYGQVDVKDVHNALLESDILINIGSLVETQITGKIFEYVSTGKPIISFYKNDNEPSIPYLKKYPLALLIHEDWNKLDENCNLIINFINENIGKEIEYQVVEKLYIKNTPNETADKLINYISGWDVL